MRRYLRIGLPFLITLVVMFYRRPDAFYAPQFWAEEGTAFYAEAFHEGAGSLFNSCVGYFHLYPRLVSVAASASGVPLSAVPFVFSFAWLLALFALLFWIEKRLDYAPVQRLFISLAVILIPLQSEVFMNMTNVQWVMAFFPFVIFSADPAKRTRGWFIADLGALLISGLTGPNFSVLLPLFILLGLLRRKTLLSDKQTAALLLLAIACGIAGLISLAQYGNVNRSAGEYIPGNGGFVQLVFLQYSFLFIGKLATRAPFWLMLAGIVFIAGAFFVYIRKLRERPGDRFGFFLLLAGLLYLVATIIAYRNEPGMLSPYYRGPRNFYIPAVCFTWMIIRWFDGKKYGTALLSGLMLLYAAETFLFVGRQRFEPRDLVKYEKMLEASDTLTVPIDPSPWTMHLAKPEKKNSR